jgi:hypothetical protein
MDFIIPLPKTARGNAGLLVVVGLLSKLIRLAATPEHVDAPQVAQLFHSNVYRHQGLPHEIASDRDPLFMSKFWTSLFKMLHVKLRPFSSYHRKLTARPKSSIVKSKRCSVVSLIIIIRTGISSWSILSLLTVLPLNLQPHSHRFILRMAPNRYQTLSCHRDAPTPLPPPSWTTSTPRCLLNVGV